MHLQCCVKNNKYVHTAQMGVSCLENLLVCTVGLVDVGLVYGICVLKESLLTDTSYVNEHVG